MDLMVCKEQLDPRVLKEAEEHQGPKERTESLEPMVQMEKKVQKVRQDQLDLPEMMVKQAHVEQQEQVAHQELKVFLDQLDLLEHQEFQEILALEGTLVLRVQQVL